MTKNKLFAIFAAGVTVLLVVIAVIIFVFVDFNNDKDKKDNNNSNNKNVNNLEFSETPAFSYIKGNAELNFYMSKYASGYPGKIELTVDGRKQSLKGENNAYTAYLSDNGRYFVYSSEETNGLVLYTYSEQMKTFYQPVALYEADKSSNSKVYLFKVSVSEKTDKVAFTYIRPAGSYGETAIMELYNIGNRKKNIVELSDGIYPAGASDTTALPVFSPDGRKVVLSNSGNQELLVYSTEGTLIEKIKTGLSPATAADFHGEEIPSTWSYFLDYKWSEDGKKILYRFSGNTDNYKEYVVIK